MPAGPIGHPAGTVGLADDRMFLTGIPLSGVQRWLVPGSWQIILLGEIEMNRALRTSAVGAIVGLCVSLGLSAAQASPNEAPTAGPETSGTTVATEGQEIPEVGKAVAESWRVSPGTTWHLIGLSESLAASQF